MKDIAVALDDSGNIENQTQAAIELADSHDSHLTGIYFERSFEYLPYGDSISGALEQELMKIQARNREKVADQFNSITQHRRAKTTFRVESGFNNQPISTSSGLTDLLVTGQWDSTSIGRHPKTRPDHLIMSSGRPVLVVPTIGFPDAMGTNIVIAWDQSKEAARAIHDSLPVLKKAEEVHIFEVVKGKKVITEMVAADLAEHLARHDINVDTQSTIRNEVPIGETMLSKIADLGADMLVMGGYGHSRLREYALGGTTRTLLNSMTVPTIMAH